MILISQMYFWQPSQHGDPRLHPPRGPRNVLLPKQRRHPSNLHRPVEKGIGMANVLWGDLDMLKIKQQIMAYQKP